MSKDDRQPSIVLYTTITEHIQNVFKEGELTEDSVCREFRRTGSDSGFSCPGIPDSYRGWKRLKGYVSDFDKMVQQVKQLEQPTPQTKSKRKRGKQ